MNVTTKFSLMELQTLEMPFNRKPHIILTRKHKHKHFKQYIQKTIIIGKNDRLIFEAILTQIKDFLKEIEQIGSELALQSIGIEVSERQGRLYYDITRSFIIGNTLKECLIQNKPQIKPTPHILAAFLKTYLKTINLNHIVCSASNIFVSFKPWSKLPIFEFNYTSIGFIFDVFRNKAVHRLDLAEYSNYLPNFFYKEEKIMQRFDFYLKVRSFAVNLLSIVLQRNINFIKNDLNVEEYEKERVQLMLAKIHKSFEEFLDYPQIKWTIKAASIALNVNLQHFFQVVILKPKTTEFQEFDSWGKVALYFKVPFFSSYESLFSLENSSLLNKNIKNSYLQGWIWHQWSEEHEFIKDKFTRLGVIKCFHKYDLILYLLYKYKLVNELPFVNAGQAYHPQFIKQLITSYHQIINSRYFVEFEKKKLSTVEKERRKEFLLSVVNVLNEYLSDIAITEAKQQYLFVSNEIIDINLVHEKCWYFRLT